jgi:hypothetical protein
MSRNGDRHPARPSIELSGGPKRGTAGASPEEAAARGGGRGECGGETAPAAIAAAIEQFMRDTAPAPVADGPPVAPWARAALLEGTRCEPSGRTPWGDSLRWGA